jgi:hypothetical protein
MDVHFLRWLFNGFIFLINTHQCFQFQNLLCAYNKLLSHKWFNIATICYYTCINTHMCTYTQTHSNKSQNNIYIFVYIHKWTCTTSYLLGGPACL